ncbi:MAG: universal stress protein [Deltaproteobacteria bacterium]|nr:universal stress protein [Deltaproteobacteria bacterium]
MERSPICPARLERLLVCTDGSEASRGAIAGTLALAELCGSKIYFLTVLEFYPELETRAPEMVAQREIEMRKHLESCKAMAEQLDIPVETLVRRSEHSYEAIIEEAEKIQPDMIIMGRHGRSRLFRLMMGNVVARVIGYSPFNVLVIPAGVPLKFERILLASDGSPYSAAAWEEARFITKRVGADLIAVSVARDEDKISTAWAIVKKLKEEAALQGLEIQTLVYQGRPYLAIIEAASDKKADLIVMGALGMTELSSFLMGSVTERVVAYAHCAVMVVKRAI